MFGKFNIYIFLVYIYSTDIIFCKGEGKKPVKSNQKASFKHLWILNAKVFWAENPNCFSLVKY